MYLHRVSIERTYTGLRTLRPCVASVSVACTSAVLVPSTTGSAATGSAGFLERAALWTRHRLGAC